MITLSLENALGAWFDGSPQAQALADASGRIVRVSQAFCSLVGRDAEEIVGQYPRDLAHTADRGDADLALARILSGQSIAERTEKIFQHSSGRPVPASVSIGAVIGDNGRVEAAAAYMNDLSVLRDQERRLHEAEGHLRLAQARNEAIVTHVQEGIWVLTPDGRTDFINAKMLDILGLTSSAVQGRHPATLLDETEATMLRPRLLERALRGPEEYELAYSHPDGSVRMLRIKAAPLEFGDGAFVGSLALVSDVTRDRTLESELRRATVHDPLTGLPNRTLLMDRLEQAVLRTASNPGRTVALLYVDLDQFKLVNDTKGYDVGDEVLVVVAARLSAVAGGTGTVARLSGDEFVVLLETDEDWVSPSEQTADRILAALGEPIVTNDHTLHVTASVGVATIPPAQSADALRFADLAMFAAKAGGRAQVRAFDPALAEEAEKTYRLTGDLRSILGNNGLEAKFQPIVRLTTGQISGYEMLARWNHPELGPIPPGLFVPLAERIGLGQQLDEWAIRRGCAEAALLEGQGRLDGGAYVSINLSGQNVCDPKFVRLLVATTESAGLHPRHVCLEITERALMENTDRSVAQLERLRAAGFPIAIDDFGTGFSSMAYLRDFPITSLKIDRSFISDITQDSDARAIAHSIIQLGKAVGATTIAEGVESEEQAALLRKLGCVAAQGWLWSRAVTTEELCHLPPRYPPVPIAPPTRQVKRRGEQIGLEQL